MNSPTLQNINDSVKGSWSALLIGHLVIIDLLFFPYFQYVILPYSLPVVLVGIRMNGKISMPRNFGKILGTIFVFVGISLLASFILPVSSEYVSENIKRVLQFATSFAYFLYFYRLAQAFGSDVFSKKIVVTFLIYYSFLSFGFYLDPLITNELMTLVYGRLVVDVDTILQHFRFSYMFSDPNTGAYFLLIAAMPLMQTLSSRLRLVIVFIMIVGIVVISQSRGAVLALFLSAILYRRASGGALWMVFVKTLLASLVVLAVIQLAERYTGEDHSVNDAIVYRLTDKDSVEFGSSSRTDLWKYYSSILVPLPVGRGYRFDVESIEFRPHSDLLRLTYSYGFVVSALFIILLFRRILLIPLLIVPALIAFSINSLIDEQKVFALFLSLLGMYYGGAFGSEFVNLDSTAIRSDISKRTFAEGDLREINPDQVDEIL
jgi:hypothetical protein